MKRSSCILLVAILVIAMRVAVSGVYGTAVIELVQTENHHVIELNSNQPYVAGYQVITPNLSTFEGVRSTVVTVSFPSTDPKYFPSGSWLGAGMFVQGQDIKLKHVDYAFYTMLVLDASGDFFLDVGLHQTRESTAPLQMPTEDLVYAYTWQINGIDHETPVTLLATLDQEGFVHYAISASGTNVTLPPVNVAVLLGCESIIRHFFEGNNVAGISFPHGHYVYYFQFGVVSSQIIANDQWSVDLKDPVILRRLESRLGAGWHPVDTAWSTQGDISYLDYDWMWGGAPYYGVSAQYYEHPFENPYEVTFFYNGQTLRPGTIFWQKESSKTNGTAESSPTLYNQIFKVESTPLFLAGIVVYIGLRTKKFGRGIQKKKSMNFRNNKRIG